MRYCGFYICQEDKSQKHNLACRVLWNYCLGNSLLGICVYFCECIWERKREGKYPSILGEANHRFIRLSRVLSNKNSFIRPVDFSGLQFPTLDTWGLDWPQGPLISFILSPNTPQQIQSWKASLTPTFITCVPSARPLLSGPQFPHISHELIRGTAVWGCCRIKWKVAGRVC